MLPCITNISHLGFWMIINEKEYFISFADYPAFHKATVDEIFNYQVISPEQFRWPVLDIDIELDSLENPSLFPLVYG
jgi:hypothetical protein